ncbi:hypothetical protein PVAND_016277 [Polypedilum vanderplanki]|uniref:dynamin GTPase n=1 Tax=Polypedilum vanderplanki TaxID=319348 RepID=A0A9J6BFR0_POLVA|nr:hypothetical protein PVAND_016277 [Polypedilum vanderplanki]
MEDEFGMKNLVLTVNKLQEIFAKLTMQIDIDLPQIAVVGIQSSGKSSVLEKFIAKDFLPRGSGIVTRRPLILQLINNEDEFAKFDHSPEIFYDFYKIQREIEAETERVVGGLKAVSSMPIVLKIFSPNVLNLTLVDLPGITKVPIGDQPSDIENQVREMIFEYITKENCLILAVTPANIDIANSEALKLAREVDPLGKRTIGVITKLDLMDSGTDAVDILENKIFPLERGYVGVVNRSQKDLDEKLDIKIAAELENEYFENHPAYKHMAHRMGTAYLQKVLNKQLVEHIFKTLPTLRDRLRKYLMGLEDEYNHIESTSNVKLMNEVINQLKQEFRSELDGYGQKEVSMKGLTTGATINEIFNIKLQKETFNMHSGGKDLRSEIGMTIRNVTGMYSNIFIPEKAFDRVVTYFIEKMKPVITKYVDEISMILQNNVRKYTDKINRYPNLREELRKLVITYIVEREVVCKDRLIEMVDSEMSYINKIHEDFCVFDEAKKIEEEDIVEKQEERFFMRGYMHVSGGLVSSERRWFVLTPDILCWYKDESEREMEGQIPLGNLKISDFKKSQFKLSEIEGKPIFKDSMSLKLICKSPEEAKEWIENMSRIGISYQKSSTLQRGESGVNIDTISIYGPETPFLTRKNTNFSRNNSVPKETYEPDKPVKHSTKVDQQVDTIKNLTEKYLMIVIKNTKDRVPKMITWLLINNVNNYIDKDLVTHFYENDIVDHAMQRPPSEQERIDNVKTMYSACKEALDIIDKEYERITVKYFD